MAELVALGRQVAAVMGVGPRQDGHPLHDLQPVGLHSHHLAGVISQQNRTVVHQVDIYLRHSRQ